MPPVSIPLENEYSIPEQNTYDIPRSVELEQTSSSSIEIKTEEKVRNCDH